MWYLCWTRPVGDYGGPSGLGMYVDIFDIFGVGVVLYIFSACFSRFFVIGIGLSAVSG